MIMASFSRKASQKSTSRRSHTLIESPVVKRVQNQPVTLQSWLLKRGSEGLMLWKKRWCVLSDYCLFYYKDQSEEKLLGSLILASYEISACNPEEKGFKKFSFKAEHANMKTFYFAAENQFHMEEWMKALTCASLLEGNYSLQQRLKFREIAQYYNSKKYWCLCDTHFGDDCFRNKLRINFIFILFLQFKLFSVLLLGIIFCKHLIPEMFSIYLVSCVYVNVCPTRQMKMKISIVAKILKQQSVLTNNNDCSYVVPSYMSDDRKKSTENRVFSQSTRFYEETQPTPNSDLLLGNQKSPEAQPVYANAPPKPKRLNESSSPECSIEMQFRDDNYQTYQSQSFNMPHSTSGQSPNFTIMQPQHVNYERRTPDIYGRASFVQPVTKPVNHNNLYIQDEQDVLSNFTKEQIISYTPKNSSSKNHSRPHSVDFLEYASKTDSSAVGSDIIDKPSIPYRPKSSLSAINSNEEEGTHWSAEEYARKMRQSSMYVKSHMKTSLPVKTEALLVNKSFIPQSSAYTTESPAVQHDLIMKSERAHSSRYRTQHSIETNEKPFFRSASARLFRPMSPIAPLNEIKQPINDHKLHNSPGVNRNSDDPVTNACLINKHQQRDKPLERLLLWKERMSQSPLQRKNTEKMITDQPSSYTIQMRKNNNSILTNENCKLHTTTTSDLLSFCEGGADAPLNDISLQIEDSHIDLAMPMSSCNYSPDHHGFEESEPNQENLSINLTNNSQKDKRKINFEMNTALFNEAKRSNSPPVTLESVTNKKINNNYDQPEDKSLLNLRAKYSVSNDDENSLRNVTSNSKDNEINKMKRTTNSLTHEELNKKSDRKQLPSKLNLVEAEKDEEWGIKLDESRVIKEFSYHYITADKYEECSPIQNNSIHSHFKSRLRKPSTSQNRNVLQDSKSGHQILPILQPGSITQNIRNNELSKTFGNNVVYNKKEINNCQKISNKNQRKFSKSGIISKGSSLRSFRKETAKSFSKETVTDPIKFHDNFEKRQVQSDSEALLYDTSSDVEEKPIFHREHFEKPIISSDDERDEEVAAVLANDKNLIAPNFELVSSHVINSPGLENGEKSMHCSKELSSIELGITTKDLVTNTGYQICHEKNLSASTDVNSDIQEENYMPMTPRKKSSKNETVHSRSNSASHTLIIENLLGGAEENPYVEMTQNGPSNSCLVSNSFHKEGHNIGNQCAYSATSETHRYCEIGKNKDAQYEFIYNAAISQEPVYMEVSALKVKRDHNTSYSMINGKNTDPLNFKQNNSKENISQNAVVSRPSLPDILNTTPSLNQGSGGSDSSDADDEASKDLDSLDAPRHPRFSLSDTFRPASYYLGGSLGDRTIIAINSEHPDSSDSDLVSPPPIPTSSPPLDDLDISMDSTIANKEHVHQVQLKKETSNGYKNEIFNESTMKELRSSYKLKKILRNSNANLYEASSEESVDYEKREQRLKRRPLSADILNSLQDFNFIMPSPEVEMLEDSENAKLKRIYIEDNENVERSNLFNLNLYKYKDKKYNNFENREDTTIDIYDNDSLNDFRYKDNRLNQSEPIYSSNFSGSSQKNDEDKISLVNQYENLRGQDYEANDCKIIFEKDRTAAEAVSCKDKYSSNFNIVNAFTNSNTDHQNNAPYYYSDLLKLDTKNFQEYEKSKWEDQSMSDINENVSSTLLNEKNVCYHLLRDCSSQNKSSGMYKDGYCSPDTSNIENCDKQDMNINQPKSPDYFDNTYNTIHNSKSFHEQKGREPSDLQAPHRSRSLEGLLDNHENSVKKYETNIFQKNSIVRLLKTQSQKTCLRNKLYSENSTTLRSKSSANPDMWEEDSLWRESLRKVSIRHTRSLEDLDRKDDHQTPIPSSHKRTEETYENIDSSCILDNNTYTVAKDNPSSNNIDFLKNDTKTKNDLFHSNFKKPEIIKKNIGDDSYINSDSGSVKTKETEGTNNSFEIDREKLRQWDLMSSAPAMLSSNRAVIKPITERNAHFPSSPLSGIENRTGENIESVKENRKSEKLTAKSETNGIIQQDHEQGHGWNLKVSAGELLGRTHEELVLLLIQLRRQRASVCQSMEKCHREIEAQACLTDLDKSNRVDHLQKLDELKARLADLEKQYEKGKPLVNLVDNMVKLGSLYQAGSPEKLEFIQRIQEQRLLAEEKRDWERIRPDHHELKAKVERLYRLDKLLQEESGTLHSLQQDKGVLERALGGLRTKLQGIHGNSPETEWYKRQQRLLEKELSRVRSILALNSKKLEETVAENARLEQELVVLRQKLQLSRRTAEPGGTNTAALEAELCQVQLLVGNLLRQRQELSLQVRQLTEKSNSLSKQIWPNSTDNSVDNYNSGKKIISNGWVETDLDAEVLNDINSTTLHTNRNVRQHPLYTSPLYVNTASERDIQCASSSPYQDELFETAAFSLRNLEFTRLSEMNDEEIMKQSYGIHFKEKPQEIKTVRIVKRESERRQRDRDRSGNIGIPINYTTSKRLPITEERYSDKEKREREFEEVQVGLEPKLSEAPPTPGPRTDSMNAVWNLVRKNRVKGKLTTNKTDENDSLIITNESPQLSPVYLSETARKIVEEVAWQGMGEKRLVPKEKRRHHTVSGPSLSTPHNLFSQTGSRDDLDIERVLRPRLTTPDVVRSTLIRVDPHYTKETIDNLLGAPGKILIPERYIPETQPQLSKEEQNKRSKKADAIRKMLCETTAVSPKDNDADGFEKTSSLKRKVAEEKKNREHLLQLSHILAQQVMEKSKIVAGGNSTPLD